MAGYIEFTDEQEDILNAIGRTAYCHTCNGEGTYPTILYECSSCDGDGLSDIGRDALGLTLPSQ